jgi:signal transduction histidine kinase
VSRAIALPFIAALPLLPALALAAPPDDVAGQLQPRVVLAIHWGPEDYPGSPVLEDAIRGALALDAGMPIDYFAEYLESYLFAGTDASDALADYIRRKYRHRPIDVVIAVSDPSLRFVLDHRADLFPGVPIVYSGFAFPAPTGKPPDGLTGVMRSGAYGQTLELALALHPSTERVFVISNGLDPQINGSVRTALSRYTRRVQITYLDESSPSRLIAAVSAIPPASLVLYVWHWQESSGSVASVDQMARVVAASPVPVYGTNERFVGSGVVGGMVRRTSETGTRMGQMVVQLLGGARPEDIPVENARLVPTFDWNQLRRWGINQDALPADAEIRFRIPSVWESYRPHIIVVAVLLSAQLLLIAGLVTQRARRRGVETALRTSEGTLRTSYRRIRDLATRLINVQEQTRADIARDLHDDVCQELVALSLGIRRLRGARGGIQEPRLQGSLTALEEWALSVADAVRQLSHELHPQTLGLLGLGSALKAYCSEVRKRHDVAVTFASYGEFKQIRPDLAVSLFRITQEAVRNAISHGAGRQIAVSVSRGDRDIELMVTDDGKGFDVAAVRLRGSGLGLITIEERAHAAGGVVRVSSQPGEGTTLYVRVPVDEDQTVQATEPEPLQAASV